MEISEVLKEEAIEHGLCEQWTAEWREGSDKEALCDKLIHKWGVAWHIKFDWPKSDYIKENFPRELLERKHIFVDSVRDDIMVEIGNYIVEGTSDVTMYARGLMNTYVYVRENAKVTLEVYGLSILFVEAYDMAKITVHNHGLGKVIVYCRGMKSSCEKTGNVLVRERTLCGQSSSFLNRNM